MYIRPRGAYDQTNNHRRKETIMNIYVSAEEYDRLQAELERPAQENPKLRALLADRAITP